VWDGDEGDDWARDWQRYDRAVAAYHAALVERARFARNDAVLDVGCGNGETTRAAARAASDGSALGVDLSTKMLERARELAANEGLTNARFERADAQVHDFGARPRRSRRCASGAAGGGFGRHRHRCHDRPFWLGADPRDAFDFVESTGIVRGLLQGLDDEQRRQSLADLETAIAAHATADGVVFGSGVVLISARKP
jgi:SAM-dependent methyltransferase